jgi:hypothetical protein
MGCPLPCFLRNKSIRGWPKINPKSKAVKKAPPDRKVMYLKRLNISPPSEK